MSKIIELMPRLDQNKVDDFLDKMYDEQLITFEETSEDSPTVNMFVDLNILKMAADYISSTYNANYVKIELDTETGEPVSITTFNRE